MFPTHIDLYPRMTIEQMSEWAEQVSTYDVAACHRAQEILRRSVTIRRIG